MNNATHYNRHGQTYTARTFEQLGALLEMLASLYLRGAGAIANAPPTIYLDGQIAVSASIVLPAIPRLSIVGALGCVLYPVASLSSVFALSAKYQQIRDVNFDETWGGAYVVDTFVTQKTDADMSGICIKGCTVVGVSSFFQQVATYTTATSRAIVESNKHIKTAASYFVDAALSSSIIGGNVTSGQIVLRAASSFCVINSNSMDASGIDTSATLGGNTVVGNANAGAVALAGSDAASANT